MMEIKQITFDKETEKEVLTYITFKTFWGVNKVERCITPKDEEYTIYFKDGRFIPLNLWVVVKTFIRTGEQVMKK